MRAPWDIESEPHWKLDVIFDDARRRIGKDLSPLNPAVRILKADKSKGSLRRKRLRACIDPNFRSSLFAA